MDPSFAATLGPGLESAAGIALIAAVALLLKSFKDFSQTGPQMRQEIRRHFRLYALIALGRLTFWAFILCLAMAGVGLILYLGAVVVFDTPFHWPGALIAAAAGILLLSGLQFCRHLLYLPASIAASYQYRKSRLYPLWRRLTPRRLRSIQGALFAGAVGLLLAAAWKLHARGEPAAALALIAITVAFSAAAYTATHKREPRPVAGSLAQKPNILMIGSDTLRADRLGAAGYRRKLTPFIDSLAARGTQFTDCYVPCARTAPSLISFLTGTWPQTHGVRDNFVGDADTRLPVPGLAEILAEHGYATAAVSDWSGGDLRKFPLGFGRLDLPDDQWNIKYFLRQGPKDLRLFLSLFTHNRFGKWALPELYYLAGVPLTSLVGRDTRSLISESAANGQPFFLNVFVSTTHPPFGSEHPYYTRWSDPGYAGESKFVMARLTDPWEIIRRQGDTKKEFDLDQIIDLYDGCVENFDSEVERIIRHLRDCNLESNTIIVIFSDHGMEFFEHDTWGQGNSVRGDFSARVPLVIFDPRRKGGALCRHVVRSVDLVPTLLELVGILPNLPTDGVSLVPYLKGRAADMQLAAFNETGIWLTDVPGLPANHLRYPNLLELLDVPDKRSGTLAIKAEYRQAIIAAKDRMVRVGSWKLIYQPTANGPLYALFNIAVDPECRCDVASEHPARVRELQDLLLRWMGVEASGAAPTTSVDDPE